MPFYRTLRRLGLAALLCLTVPLAALEWNGEFTSYGSIAFADGTFPKNEAATLLSAEQRVGDGQIRFSGKIFASSAHDSSPAFLLRELEYTRNFEFADSFLREISLQAGLSRFTWGKSDELRILDILNPQYLNFLQFDGIEERKLGRMAISAAVTFGEGSRFELILLPGMSPSVLDNRELMPKALADLYRTAAAFPGISISRMEQGPAGGIGESALALRFRDRIGSFDYDLYLYRGNDNLPGFAWRSADFSNPTNLQGRIEEQYPRLTMLGADCEFPLGSFVLRADLAFFASGKSYAMGGDAGALDAMSGGNGLLVKKSLAFVIGIDTQHFLFPDLYANLQYGMTAVLEHDDRLLAKAVENTLTLRLEYGAAGDRFRPAIGLGWLIDRGLQLNPEYRIRLDDGAGMALGIWLLWMEKTDYLLGDLDGQDFGYLSFHVKY
jgi:hypothetical protein